MTESAVAESTTWRKVLAWSLWDWGSSAFNAVIVTFIFSVYLVDAVGDDLPGSVSASSWLGWSVGLGGLFVALLAPVLGRRSDAGGHRRRTLALLTYVVVALMTLLFFVHDDWHDLWLALAVFAVGTVLFELCQVPYFAMLRQVSTPETIGRVSGIGWAFGYLGGIVLLLICYFGFITGEGGLLGLPTDDGYNIRVVALVAAAWFALFALPVLFGVPELPADATPVEPGSFFGAYRDVFADVKRLWSEERSVVGFLIAQALYRDGLAGVFTFGAVLAVSVYGIDKDAVILFGVAANVVSAAGAWVAGSLDDRLGPRPVIVFSLASMLVSGGILVFLSGPLSFWIFGLLLCLFVGPAQSASRTYLVRLAPVGREGELVGLYAMTGRAASFLAPTLFGLAVFVGGSDRWGIVGILVVLGAGLVALLRVNGEVHDRAMVKGNLN